ncbi:homoserine kinase [Luteimonas sp. e5]
MSRTSATAFAPASVGNIGIGFDLLGHSIDGPRDVASVRRIEAPQVVIEAIDGDSPGIERIPLQASRNTAGQALLALREALALPFGFALHLHKGIPLGSGLGGSAASCVAALVAANALIDQPLSREALYPHALAGESVASGSVHGDNVGPMLLGGVAMTTRERLIALPSPPGWHAVVVHPDQVLETRASRAVLEPPYPLADVVAQTTHLALFLHGLREGDATLVAEGLNDVLVEPRRAPLIPRFAEVKQAALQHGAIGASISGGGPSVFAWFATRAAAEAAAPAMRAAFTDGGIHAHAHVSPVAGPRAEVLA